MIFAIRKDLQGKAKKFNILPLITISEKKEKLKCIKSGFSLFILYSSFCERPTFTARKVRFDRPKGYVSSHET